MTPPALLLVPPRGYAVHGCPLEVITWEDYGHDHVTLALAVPELQLSSPPRVLTRWALVEHPLAPLHAILELWQGLEDRQADLILAGGGRVVKLVTTRRATDHPDGPLGHAVTWSARRRPGRSTMDALCGAQVARAPGGSFDPEHPRACPSCAAVVRRVGSMGSAS